MDHLNYFFYRVMFLGGRQFKKLNRDNRTLSSEHPRYQQADARLEWAWEWGRQMSPISFMKQCCGSPHSARRQLHRDTIQSFYNRESGMWAFTFSGER